MRPIIKRLNLEAPDLERVYRRKAAHRTGHAIPPRLPPNPTVRRRASGSIGWWCGHEIGHVVFIQMRNEIAKCAKHFAARDPFRLKWRIGVAGLFHHQQLRGQFVPQQGQTRIAVDFPWRRGNAAPAFFPIAFGAVAAAEIAPSFIMIGKGDAAAFGTVMTPIAGRPEQALTKNPVNSHAAIRPDARLGAGRTCCPC